MITTLEQLEEANVDLRLSESTECNVCGHKMLRTGVYTPAHESIKVHLRRSFINRYACNSWTDGEDELCGERTGKFTESVESVRLSIVRHSEWGTLTVFRDESVTGFIDMPEVEECIQVPVSDSLIAAAPELLEACRRLLNHSALEMCARIDMPESADETCKFARSAIAKAEGATDG